MPTKLVTRTRFLVLSASVIACALLLVYRRRQTEGRPSSPIRSAESSAPPNTEELTEIPTLPASAFVIPEWKRPLGMDYWPGVRQPPTLSADKADLQDDAEVIGVCVAGRARAYCISAFSGYPVFHVVNDVLAGRPLSVVYCDLTRCTRTFTATSGSTPLALGISGWKADKGLILHLEGVDYALVDGKNLTQPQEPSLPYQQMKRARTTWGQWRRAHPDTDVYKRTVAQHSIREKEFWPGIRQPKTQSAEEANLDENAEVIGVCIEGKWRAYWVAALSGYPEFHVVNDVLAGHPVTVAYCDLGSCARVFTTNTGSSPLDLGTGGYSDETGMMLYLDGIKYALKDGKNITYPEEPSLPYPLLEHQRMTWGQWRHAHPNTDVYLSPPSTSKEEDEEHPAPHS